MRCENRQYSQRAGACYAGRCHAEEGHREAFQTIAIKELLAWQLEKAM